MQEVLRRMIRNGEYPLQEDEGEDYGGYSDDDDSFGKGGCDECMELWVHADGPPGGRCNHFGQQAAAGGSAGAPAAGIENNDEDDDDEDEYEQDYYRDDPYDS